MVNPLVIKYREEIDKIVNKEERINILAELKATTREFINDRFKVRNNPNPPEKAKLLLNAINDFDKACIKGENKLIRTTGNWLIKLWKEHVP